MDIHANNDKLRENVEKVIKDNFNDFNEKVNKLRKISDVKTGTVIITYKELNKIKNKETGVTEEIIQDFKVFKMIGLLLDSVSILVPTKTINENNILKNNSLNVKFITSVGELNNDFSKVYYYETFKDLNWGIFFMKDQIGEYYYHVLQMEKFFYKMDLIPDEFKDVSNQQESLTLITYYRKNDELVIGEINVEKRFFVAANSKDLLIVIPRLIMNSDPIAKDLKDLKEIEGGFVYFHDKVICGVFDKFIDKEDEINEIKKYAEDKNDKNTNNKKEYPFNKAFLETLVTFYKNFYFINIKLFSEDIENDNDNDLLKATGVVNNYKNILYSAIGVYTFSKDVS